MKLWKEPIEQRFGTNYNVGLTDEFEEIIETAKEKIHPFAQQEVSGLTTYFRVKGEDVSSEYDTCDNQKCIDASKRNIREHYGKGTRVEECWTENDGDHDKIEICTVCSKPLNEYLTWCESELDHLEQNKPWNAEFLKEEGFLILAILESMPTGDCKIDSYHITKGGQVLENALQRREKFFQRILELAQAVISADFPQP